MLERYNAFGPSICAVFASPTLQAISQILTGNGPLPEGKGPAMDSLAEETLRRCRGSMRGSAGKLETSAAKICETLEIIRDAVDRLSDYPVPDRLNSEHSFREWLERGIVTSSAHEEPSFLPGADPIQKAIENLDRLKNTPEVFSQNADLLAFPLTSFKITTKPKTPTGFDPFDEVELEEGAEEDTVMILSGESNIGKSHLGLFCLSSLSLRREAVLLCSGEDSLETTRRRIFAHYLRRTARDVAAMSELDRELEFTRLYGDKEDQTSLHYHIATHVAVSCIPEGAFHPKAIEERIDAFEQKTGRKVRAFMADYLQKMGENPAGKNTRRARDEELENTVNQVKDICQRKKTFGLIISQVPSHAAGGAGEFLNLRQAVARSYAATWGAHYVVTINRPADETKRLAASSDKRPRLNLFLCKNKDGPLGVCYTLGYPSEARWEFFRTKAELIGQIESGAAEHRTSEISPSDFRKIEDKPNNEYFPGRGLT